MLRPNLHIPPEGWDGGDPQVAVIALFATAIQARLKAVRRARDAGLATVEVAIITAVLLGLAVALLAAITVAVRRRQSQIQ